MNQYRGMRIRLNILRLAAVAMLSNIVAGAVQAQQPASLQVLQPNYPQAFFFRSSEGMAANPRMPFDRWEACFSRLMGIEGKVLDEEIPGRSLRNIDFFTRFKKQHPDQLVLLHYNGNARDPRFQMDDFFAGHFLYFNGAKILENIPAEEGETEIKVDNPALFRTDIGRYRWSNDDVGLCELDAEGKPDWHKSEQVELVSVDVRRKTIRVKRGSFGTTPRAFPAGQSYAAAHVTEGPWGQRSNLLWYYNYSTVCPRDEEGRICSEVHVEDLARRFLPGGELAAFDGLEFDVLHHQVGHGGLLGPDCDADGQIDDGLFDGVNQYGIGVVEFCGGLREKLGPQRLILADGMSLGNQRAAGILNGIESEGWPTLSDWEIRDWSGGLNRHWFWGENAHQPVFNYINHKFTTAGESPGSRVTPKVPFAVHRLVFASAMFTDAAICYAFTPPKGRDELVGIWDEFRKGTENQLGWLEKPLGPTVRMAQTKPDLLKGRGDPIDESLAGQFMGDDLSFTLEDGRLTVAAENCESGQLRFRLNDVPCDGSDLFVSLTASAQPLAGYPSEIPRLTWLGIAPPEGQLVLSDPPQAGMCLRSAAETQLIHESGAGVRFIQACEMGGEAHDAYNVHPPYRQAVGYTFWRRDVRVPEESRLEFFTGMGEKSPQRSDGVLFRVLAAEITDGEAGEFQPLFEHTQVEHEWIPHKVPLAEWGGKRIRLKFVSDCGPADNSTTDHSYWGDVNVLGPRGGRSMTEPVRYMTWLNESRFTSGFYFSDVKSESVNLELLVEGTEPISISSIRVHAHADAIYREFEHGVVLANPSPRDYDFDLARLLPGGRFRRLVGSPEQDPTANDGSAVNGPVTLGPKEGLFLVRQQ